MSLNSTLEEAPKAEPLHTAGLTVATRLALNVSRSVLVIEAGPRIVPGSDARVDIPGFAG